jgi:hypothetical protein
VKAVAIDRFKEPGAFREMPDPMLDRAAVIIRAAQP